MKALYVLGLSVALAAAAMLGVFLLIGFGGLVGLVFGARAFAVVGLLGVLALVTLLYLAGGRLLHGRPPAICRECGRQLSLWQRYFWGCTQCTAVTNSATVEYSPNDHSQLAGTYLIGLGVFNLLWLNFGGLLLIWFGEKVRERHEGFRRVTLWLLGLGLLICMGTLVWATVAGTERVTVTVPFREIDAPPLWLVYVVLIPILVIYSLPVYWLTKDSYKPPRT
jgi:hypothetical protein